MELLSQDAEKTFDRLVRYAKGRKALVTVAIDKYNSGEIEDLLDFIDEGLREAERAAAAPAAASPKSLSSD